MQRPATDPQPPGLLSSAACCVRASPARPVCGFVVIGRPRPCRIQLTGHSDAPPSIGSGSPAKGPTPWGSLTGCLPSRSSWSSGQKDRGRGRRRPRHRDLPLACGEPRACRYAPLPLALANHASAVHCRPPPPLPLPCPSPVTLPAAAAPRGASACSTQVRALANPKPPNPCPLVPPSGPVSAELRGRRGLQSRCLCTSAHHQMAPAPCSRALSRPRERSSEPLTHSAFTRPLFFTFARPQNPPCATSWLLRPTGGIPASRMLFSLLAVDLALNLHLLLSRTGQAEVRVLFIVFLGAPAHRASSVCIGSLLRPWPLYPSDSLASRLHLATHSSRRAPTC